MSKKTKASYLLLQGLSFIDDFKFSRCYTMVWTLRILNCYVVTIMEIVIIYAGKDQVVLVAAYMGDL